MVASSAEEAIRVKVTNLEVVRSIGKYYASGRSQIALLTLAS